MSIEPHIFFTRAAEISAARFLCEEALSKPHYAKLDKEEKQF